MSGVTLSLRVLALALCAVAFPALATSAAAQGGTGTATLNGRAIAEFQVVSMGGTAEFGRAIGGIVNAVTKSGTKAFAGDDRSLQRLQQGQPAHG